MSWNVIDHKMISIRTGLNQWELVSLERQFSEIIKRSTRISSQARSIQGVMFIDLAYALSRHRDWLEVPVFSALLIDFLQLDHGLPRKDSEILTHELIDAAIELGVYRQRSICSDDREFLTWAYVCAAGASDEDQLDADLGLGTAVLRKLRDGLQAIDQVESRVFIPEYDAMLATIVLELGHECKSKAWAMDYHRLRYFMLAAAGDSAQPFILEEALPTVFETLVRIGQGDSDSLQDRPDLASILVRAGVLCDTQPQRKGRKVSHQLTDLGARTTALCVALSRDHSDFESGFVKMNQRWQEAIIRHSQKISITRLVSFITENLNKLSPEVIECSLAKVIELDKTRLTGDVVRDLLKNSLMGWHKAAVIRALRRMKPSREILDAVASELSMSMSPGVRLAAGGLLDQWTSSN